ncbi:MAG: hypothetical protein JST84_04360 [Acidobacteria bacterium]|nr:hypothetical protein [Acidobacteriota bacterium]
MAEAEMESCDYIETYYNWVRRHSALRYISPLEYERPYYQRTATEPLHNQPERSMS